MDCWMGYWKAKSPGRPYKGKFMVSTRESLKVAKARRLLSGLNHRAELELKISSVNQEGKKHHKSFTLVYNVPFQCGFTTHYTWSLHPQCIIKVYCTILNSNKTIPYPHKPSLGCHWRYCQSVQCQWCDTWCQGLGPWCSTGHCGRRRLEHLWWGPRWHTAGVADRCESTLVLVPGALCPWYVWRKYEQDVPKVTAYLNEYSAQEI